MCNCQERKPLEELRAHYAKLKRLKEIERTISPNAPGAEMLIKSYIATLLRIDEAIARIPACGDDCDSKREEGSRAASAAENGRLRAQIDVNARNIGVLAKELQKTNESIRTLTDTINKMLRNYDPLKK